MMTAILMAVVRFLEAVVTYSLAAGLAALGIVGLAAAARHLLAEPSRGAVGRAVTALRRGSGVPALAAALVCGLIAGLVALTLRTR